MSLSCEPKVGVLATQVADVTWDSIERNTKDQFWLSMDVAAGTSTMLHSLGFRVLG